MPSSQRFSAWAAAAYASMLLGGIGLFLMVRRLGETLSAPAPVVEGGSVATSGSQSDILFHLLIALAAVVIVGRLLEPVFRAIGQPPVMGEVIGGILLGPSLLGRISPEAYRFILPPEVAPFLGIVAQLGVVLYMFLVGLELNPDMVRRRVHATVATSHASIVVPFVLGAMLALYLYPRFSTNDVSFTNFALFVGVAMSITAFPVLARILTDNRMNRTELGVLALTCAAVDDITAWCLLAFVVGVVQAAAGGALLVAVLTIAFIAFMFVVVQPIAVRLARDVEDRDPPPATIALVIVAMFIAAIVTEGIGVHAIFGAFLLGTVIPHESRLARALEGHFEHLATILLLPAFFAFAGMRTQVELVSGWYEWLVVALIVGVATAGKFGGTLLGARVSGLDWRSAAALGILMNTRGLMQLIVLNVGLDLGVMSPKLYTMMVLMALATTMATTPILKLILPARSLPPTAMVR